MTSAVVNPGFGKTATDELTIACLGLGRIGGAMARNLMRAGQKVIGFDPLPQARSDFSLAGGRSAETLAEAIEASDIVISSLPGPQQLEDVAFSTGGITESGSPGLIWVDCSTIDLDTGLRVHESCKALDILMIDAPVTGGAEGAQSGGLTLLIGGPADTVQKLDPIFAAFSARRYVMGPAGSGYAAKLCQLHLNYLLVMGIGEALTLAARHSLDLRTLHNALQHSCAQSYVFDRHALQLIEGDYDPSFSLGLARKDLRLICNLGDHAGVELDLVKVVHERYKEACDAYGEAAPHLSVVRILEERYGSPLQTSKRSEPIETAR